MDDPRPGSRIDMHCHSTYSVEFVPAVPWLRFYPLLTPEQSYVLAKSRGMDFVTLTDHDTIDGCKALLDRCGELPDFIVGEEVSTSFPSDGMVVHINVYDHSEAEHREIQRLAPNVFELVPYLRSIGRVFVLNHPTWNKYDYPTARQRLDEYAELFDLFEGINGSRPRAHNAWVWSLVDRWPGKSLVAGSDSHSNAVGTTYTITEGSTRAAVLANIRNGQTALCGRMGSLATMRAEIDALLATNVGARIASARSAFQRAGWRLAAEVGGRVVGPWMVARYHRRQDRLLRALEALLPDVLRMHPQDEVQMPQTCEKSPRPASLQFVPTPAA